MYESLTMDFPVRMNECAPDGLLQPYVLFNYLQQMAAEHAELLGWGMSAIHKNGFLWVLSRIKLKIDAYPRYDDTVRVETYHNGLEKIFAKRQFVWKSAKTGKPLGHGSSFWLCLDTEKLRPRSPATALNLTEAVNGDREDFYPLLDKIQGVATEKPTTRTVHASQIDLNNHMNNAYYAEYAVDWLSQTTGIPVRLSQIQINFNRAMKLGELLEVNGSVDGQDFYVEGESVADGKNSFQAAGTICR